MRPQFLGPTTLEIKVGLTHFQLKCTYLGCCRASWIHSIPIWTRVHGALVTGIGTRACRSPRTASKSLWKLLPLQIFALKTCVTPIGQQLTVNWAAWTQFRTSCKQVPWQLTQKNFKLRMLDECGKMLLYLFCFLNVPCILGQETTLSQIFIVDLFFQSSMRCSWTLYTASLFTLNPTRCNENILVRMMTLAYMVKSFLHTPLSLHT